MYQVKKIHSPVIKFNTMLVRPVATNKRAFYLMNTTQVGAQLYELQARSTNERSTWLAHISEASAAYKAKEHRFRPTNSTSNIRYYFYAKIVLGIEFYVKHSKLL